MQVAASSSWAFCKSIRYFGFAEGPVRYVWRIVTQGFACGHTSQDAAYLNTRMNERNTICLLAVCYKATEEV